MNRMSALGVGIVLALGVTAVPLGLLGSLPEPAELTVQLPSRATYQLRSSPVEQVPSPIVGPKALLDRVTSKSIPTQPATGVNLATYQVEYGHRWLEEVTVPSLVGPFEREEQSICGISIWLSSALFDTNGDARGVNSVVLRKLRDQGPLTVNEHGFSFTFPAVDHVDLRLPFGEGSARLLARIQLEDGTFISGATELTIVSDGGTPLLRRVGMLETDFGGPSFEQLRRDAQNFAANYGSNDGTLAGLVCLGTFGAGCVVSAILADDAGDTVDNTAPTKVNTTVAGALDEALAKVNDELSEFRRPWFPLPHRPRDSVLIRLARDPTIAPDGITLPLCTTFSVATPRRDPAIEGPPVVTPFRRPDPPAPDPATHKVLLLADGRTLNRVLYFLWQSGTLRELGTSTALLESLPRDVQGLAFDLKGFDPGLPLGLTPGGREGPELQVTLADVALGTWDQRTVVGHANGRISVVSQAGAVSLNATIDDVTVNCTEGLADGTTRLSPCLSDLLPALRASIQDRSFSHTFAGSDILARLPRLSFQGLRIDFSNLSVSLDGPSMSLDLRANATVEDDGHGP